MPFPSQEPLSGVRIWLSAAIPPDLEADEQAVLQRFIRRFATEVFQRGGSIIHGAHPSVRDLLMEVARAHQDHYGRRDALTLVVSPWYTDHSEANGIDLSKWRACAQVHLTDRADSNDKGLSALRNWMADRSDVLVAVGGRWWSEHPAGAGVPQEIELARRRGLPCFLLGGMRGAVESALLKQPEWLTNPRNGLSEADNRRLASMTHPDELVERVVDQLERLPLVRGQALGSGSTFRILALDGGGIKGAFTAAVLAELERLTGQQAVDHFDLIAGTSTGGILACGLAAGLPASALQDFYLQRGATIFGNAGGRLRTLVRVMRGPIFDAQVLRETISEAYARDGASVQVQNAICRLVLPAVQAATGAPQVLRTNHHPDLRHHHEDTLVDLAVATAAAPLYFRGAKLRGMHFLDGGLWANNPVLAAIVEAVVYLNVPLDRIDVLSISTTSATFDGWRLESAGLWRWLVPDVPILQAIMGSTAGGHEMLAKDLMGSARHLRIDARLPSGRVSLSSHAMAPHLVEHGTLRASDPEVFQRVRDRFLNGLHAPRWDRF